MTKTTKTTHAALKPTKAMMAEHRRLMAELAKERSRKVAP
jgi:hypothetical protein